jgi:tetratricopeptide (TPR) repeat protein
LQYADQTLALASEHGLELFRAMALFWRGWCLAALGRADEGIPLLTAGLAAIHDLGYVIWTSRRLTLLGDACRMAGQWQAAIEHLARARRLAEETEERSFQAETLRLRGDVLLAMGDSTGAEAGYRWATAPRKKANAPDRNEQGPSPDRPDQR